jgi:mannitol-1-/sugar-/sorbitol-6-/2-deoxyglucose-6-phosphatase
MKGTIKAVLFDMDGVLINSEGLWRKAMISGFAEEGIPLTESDCRKTMGMRFPEVVSLWLSRFSSLNINAGVLENRVIELLLQKIEADGEIIQGIPSIIDICNKHQIKKGVATSSSHLLMRAVLNKLGIISEFQATVSAEFMEHGKPHPEVFLKCAEELDVSPDDCIVIEDSPNGVKAAKAAGMRVIAVPEDGVFVLPGYESADFRIKEMTMVAHLIESLL